MPPAKQASSKKEEPKDNILKLMQEVKYKKMKAAGIDPDKVETSGSAPIVSDDGVIFSWEFKSSRVTAGRSPKYTILLFKDKLLSCDCPGWTFQRRDTAGNLKPRSCKHLFQVEDEAKILHKKWKNGEALPTMEVEPAAPQAAAPASIAKPVPASAVEKAMQNPNSRIRYGRVIDTD